MKIFRGCRSLDFFVSNIFHFETIKLRELFAELNAEDQKKFYFDHSTIELKSYLHEGVQSIRRLLLKEDDATLPKAREKLKKLYYVDLLVKGVAASFLLWYFAKLYLV